MKIINQDILEVKEGIITHLTGKNYEEKRSTKKYYWK